MNFEQRARKARQRGQSVRSAVLLIEGLKRHPEASGALELLTDIYVDDLDSSGLEFDLASVLIRQPKPLPLFRSILAALHQRGKASMGRDLVRAAGEKGLDLTWPPANPSPPPGEPSVDPPAEGNPEPAPRPEETPAPEPAPIQAPSANSEPAVGQAAASAPPPQEAREPKPDAQLQPDVEPAAEPDLAPEPAPEPHADPPAEPQTESQAESQAEPQPDTSSSSQTKKRQPADSPPRRLGLVAAVVALGIVAAAFWWFRGPDRGSLAALDARIERVDPDSKTAVDALFSSEASQSLPAGVADRRAFLRAVRAADFGRRADHAQPASGQASPDTAWGVAARAADFAREERFEDALTRAAVLERQYPDALASRWARGFVAEARGRYATAVEHYERGHQDFPQFAPMLTGQLRVAVRQGRRQEAAKLREALAKLSPENPYAQLDLALPRLEELRAAAPEAAANGSAANESDATRDGAEGGAEQGATPRFVRAVAALERSLRQIRGGQESDALASAEQALEAEPQLGPALLVAGLLRAGALDVERAVQAYTRLAQLPGLAMEYRWTLQIAAPRSLAGAGRADLAYQFAVPVKAAGKVSPRDTRPGADKLPEPVVPLVSVEERAKTEPLARRALFTRAQVLSLLGLGRAAAETLGLLEAVSEVAPRIGFERAMVAIRDGSRRAARSAARSGGDDAWGHGARAAVAYFSGHYEDAIDQGRLARRGQAAASIARLRPLVLSLTASQRGREALALLAEARVRLDERAALEALRTRVLGRLGPKADLDGTAYPALVALEPTSIDRLTDLAAIAFWHKRFESARTFAEKVLSVAPKHPEANWVVGLLDQIAGEEGAAQKHFRAAWRDDTDDPRLLVELGRIYLGLDEPRRAQRAFYRALLRDRKSLDALRGLGEAYGRYNRRIGKRDLSRILSGYDGRHWVAQAAETLHWLAVLEGVRDGKDAGLGYLDRATDLIGESPSLLVERARYRKARGEYVAARKLYARALEKNSTLVAARLGLARMALKTGDDSVARTQLQRYLSITPDGEQAEWARAQLETLTAKSRKAAPDPPGPRPADQRSPAQKAAQPAPTQE